MHLRKKITHSKPESMPILLLEKFRLSAEQEKEEEEQPVKNRQTSKVAHKCMELKFQ